MLRQNISQSQQQVLSADQRQSLQILAYTNQELDAFLAEEYLQNPMLECQRDRQSEIMDNLESHYETASSYRDHYIRYEEEDTDRRGDIKAREPSSLRGQLKGQLAIREFSRREWNLIDYLIDCLDDKGFFTCEPQEIADSFGCPVDTVEKCLAALQRLEPAGIFSRDISDCLLRQLEARHEEDEILLRNLFSNAASGKTDASADNVRRKIEQLVREEDHNSPLSDDRIAKILKEEGMSVSRRTVAKYRQQMGIPESRLRAYL